MRLDVTKSRELLAMLYAVQSLDKTLQKMIRVHAKAITGPVWKDALAKRANSKLEGRVLVDTAVVSVSNQNIRLQSANKGRPLSGGLNPKTAWAGVEFGASAKGKSYRRKSKNGGMHSVTRVMGTQFKGRRPSGYVVFPAAKAMIPRIASLFVQTAVKTIGNALEGKQE